MQYRPKFCCECGGKIDCAEPNWQTSGRFCEVCEGDFKFVEWKPAGVLIIALLFFLGGFAFYLYRSNSPEATLAKNLSARNNRFASNRESTENVNFNSGNQTKNPTAAANEKIALTAPPTVVTKTEKSVSPPIVSDTEKIYFCGAQTKKGTPCSRRVKGGGRCWQHQGMPAMIAEKDLAVNP